MNDDLFTDLSALGEDIIASVGCERIMVTWECGTGKLIEKIKIRDHHHHQAVITRESDKYIVEKFKSYRIVMGCWLLEAMMGVCRFERAGSV